MKITIKKNIGAKQYIFDIDKPDFNDAYREAAKVDMLPEKCDVCGKTNLYLQFRKPQGYNYPGIVCRGCGATTVIQGKRDGSEDFIKKMEKFVPRDNGRQTTKQPLQNNISQTPPENLDDFDDILPKGEVPF